MAKKYPHITRKAYRATRKSIKHWQDDILAMLEKGHKAHWNCSWKWDNDEKIKDDGVYCELCHAYSGTERCKSKCPLTLIGQNCNEAPIPNNPYRKWKGNRDRKSCKAMIRALEKICTIYHKQQEEK
jgi:hypothetical protein